MHGYHDYAEQEEVKLEYDIILYVSENLPDYVVYGLGTGVIISFFTIIPFLVVGTFYGWLDSL